MNVLTVTQVNTYIRALIEGSEPLKRIYICGEISNFKLYPSSGHMYFTLKDEKCQLKAVMFASNAVKLRFMPENGLKVICGGRISVYEKNGEYQIYADDMYPYGIGELNLAFEQLKEKLNNEGLFDESLKKELPKFPRKIGVATSNIGAAVEDIKNITARRYPLAEIVIAPTVVQGDNAAPDIVKSLKILDNTDGVDVIIVGRGGGSLEDLWAFNTEEVARAVFACKTPVVSAVGHETDFTICDFVADMRAPTPSAAAELICPDINAVADEILRCKNSIINCVNYKIEKNMQRVIELTENGVLSDYGSVIDSFGKKLTDARTKLIETFDYKTEIRFHNLAALAGKLQALSPLAVLSRGFSVAQKANGDVIKSAAQIEKNDEITLVLQDGRAVCKVKEVSNNE